MSRLPTAAKHARIPTLDGWRAVAIAGVLCAHIRWPIPALSQFFVNGVLGVQLFFALSGFLITSRLLEEHDQTGGISWKSFYLRRAFRILPPAFFVLLILALLGRGFHLIPMSADQLAASAFFYRNYLYGVVGSAWYTGHFWSLAVEEHFYLVWPAILCIVGMARGARTALTLACIAFVWRIADGHFDWIGHLQPAFHGNRFRTDYCIGELFWGCALAFLWRSSAGRTALRKVVRSHWVVGVVLLQAMLLHFKPRWYESGVEILMALLPLITVADPQGIISRVLETPVLAWIGRLSYSLYLWQQLFLPPFWRPLDLGIIQQLPLNLTAVFASASFSYYFVERPFIRLGRRLQSRNAVVRYRVSQEPVSSQVVLENRVGGPAQR